MRRVITGIIDFISQELVSGSGPKILPLGGIFLGVLLMAIPSAAQTTGANPTTERVIAPGIEAVTSYTERLEVPKKGKTNFTAGKFAMQTELGRWTTIKGSREITVPPHGFYIATLGNGTAVTVINGEEKLRHAGEMWAVQDGQSMTVKIQQKKQENVTLDIFSVRTSH